MKIILAVAAVALLVGCDNPRPQDLVDQDLRKELFMECLHAVPKGPEKIDNSNDWQEVVEECGRQAYSLSITATYSNVKYIRKGVETDTKEGK